MNLSRLKENSLIISFIQWPRGDGFEVIDAGKSLLERSAENRTENCLAHARIGTINLQNSQLRPQDRSNLSHVAIITTTSPISEPEKWKAEEEGGRDVVDMGSHSGCSRVLACLGRSGVGGSTKV